MTLESELSDARLTLAKVKDAARHGQVRGGNPVNFCSSGREQSADCARWKYVNSVPSAQELQNTITSLENQIKERDEAARLAELASRPTERITEQTTQNVIEKGGGFVDTLTQTVKNPLVIGGLVILVGGYAVSRKSRTHKR